MGQMGGVCEGRLGGHKRLPHLLSPLLAVLAARPTRCVCERLQDAGSSPQVRLVEAQHPQETQQLGLNGEPEVGLDGCHMCAERTEALHGHVLPQELH